jgi:hypothetical protein
MALEKTDMTGHGSGQDGADTSEDRRWDANSSGEACRIQRWLSVSCWLVNEIGLTRSIVAPLAVMEQWATEASTKTVPGRLKVTTHHGPSRTKCTFRA